MGWESSGVESLDSVLGGLIPGDNIVWVVGGQSQRIDRLENAFLDAGRRVGVPCSYVTTRTPPNEVTARFGSDVTVVDARPGNPLADPTALEQAVVSAARATPGRVVFDSLDTLSERWDAQRALRFFSRVCPQLFDLEALAYWRVPRRILGSTFISELQKMTQCVLEIGGGHLRVVKADGRPLQVQGQLFRLEDGEDGLVELRGERALGRLGEGLARLRQQRRLTQAEVARLAGVSPSAISQAEAGRRGLSLDTLLTLTERAGIGLDELLGNRYQGDYILARRDRSLATQPNTALLDNPALGLRAYLIRLGPGEAGTPPTPHKGVELLMVAAGLVQVTLRADTPVMRAGDALLAARVPIGGWRNILTESARLFWILRD
ncbi:MAG: helix-turn-helix domain-containing protein [Egibacteraceae bacterium]